ncbi:hypothetical protein AF332_27195 [Sporosarcina globispora]|uniref:Uncharacterized protein n=1 Tax=Sporosarcina globispora TaxID=1459 RepID=A0A0M0GKU7_SPOGL|nr:hypothetical protein AF332_27195 [Sporosarcina globispora]
MQDTIKSAKIPGEKNKYKLNGSDQTNAKNISHCLKVIEAKRAKQAGRNNIRNVITNGSVSFVFEYGL